MPLDAAVGCLGLLFRLILEILPCRKSIEQLAKPLRWFGDRVVPLVTLGQRKAPLDSIKCELLGLAVLIAGLVGVLLTIWLWQ